MSQQQTPPDAVSIDLVYCYWPHYRAAFIRAGRTRGHLDLAYFGQSTEYQGIKSYQAWESFEFRETRFVRLAGFWFQFKLLKDCFVRNPAAVVFLGDWKIVSTWVAAAVYRLRGKHVMFWTHGITSSSDIKGLLLARTFYRLADTLLLYGHHARDRLHQLGYPQSRLTVIYNSLSTSHEIAMGVEKSEASVPAGDAPYAGSSRVVKLLFVGRLTPESQLPLAIEAIALLQPEMESMAIRLVVVGAGQEAAHIEQKALECNVDVEMRGAIYDPEVLALEFNAADAVVSPGKVGLLAIHALEHGVPVITHSEPTRQMPEYEAIQPGRTGELFAYGEPADLARAIHRVINNGKSHYAGNVGAVLAKYNADYQWDVIERVVSEGRSA